MAPDAGPLRPPSGAAASSGSRKAVRGGALAALSEPPAAAQGAAASAQPPVPAPAPPPPLARGFAASLRAAGRRGLLAAKPLAMPFLHRMQMRMRTAVDDSALAARASRVEQAVARLSERFDAELADVKRLVAGVALDLHAAAAEDASRHEAALRRLDAIGRGVAGVADAAAGNARRLDAANAAASDHALRQEAALGRLDVAQQRLDEIQRRVDEVQRGVASVPGAILPRIAHRPPVPLGNDFLVYTPDGVLLVPAEDLRFLAVIAEGGVLETGTRRVLSALLRPGGVFLDIGANVGTMTLLGARAVGPAGRVIAVEPTPRITALLRRSVAVNDVAGHVVVEACAAGEEPGEALLLLEEIMSHNTLFPPDPPGEGDAVRVPVRPADDLVPAGTAVDVAKIDVEGAELQVWRGMRRILSESPGVAVVLEFGPSHLARVGVTPEAWLREVEAPGFEPYTIDDMTGACRPATAPVLAGVFSANVLLLRPGAATRHPGLVFE